MTRSETDQLVDLGFIALGGVAGAFASTWVHQLFDIKMPIAAAGMATLGALGAAMLTGRGALAAGGAAAAAAGQLSLCWMTKLIEQGDVVADSDVMNALQVAEFLGLSRNSVYDAAGRGKIPYRRVGRRLLFSRMALVKWLRCERAVSESENGYAGLP